MKTLSFLRKDHVIQAAVGLGLIATAFTDGGYSAGFIGGAGFALWWFVVLGLALGVMPRERLPRSGIAAAAALSLFAALAAFSMLWASDAGQAFEAAVRSATYAGLFLAVLLCSRRGRVQPWLSGILLGLMVVACAALLGRFLPNLGADHELARVLPSSRGRLSYPIGYWNGLAASMALLSILLGWLGAEGRTRTTRALGAALLPLPLLVIYLASSRGGVAAVVAGLLVMVALFRNRFQLLVTLATAAPGTGALVALSSQESALQKALATPAATAQGHLLLAATLGVVALTWLLRFAADARIRAVRISRSLAIATIAIAGVLVVGSSLVAGPTREWRRFKAPPAASRIHDDFIANHLASGSGSGRYQFWSAAIDAFDAQPVRGIGAGGYESWWNRHGSIPYTLKNAHSLFLESLAELGLLGVALLISFFGIVLASGLGRLNPGGRNGIAAALGLLATGVVSAAVDWTWQLPAVFAPTILACALLTGPATQSVAGKEPSRGRSGWRFALRGAAIAFGVIAILACGTLYLSTGRLADSQTAARNGRLEDALADARDAAAIEPWSASPRTQLALLAERSGDLPRARTELGLAIERAPMDWRLWLIRTRLLLRSGEISKALRSLQRARRLDPRSPLLGARMAEGAGG